MCGIVGILSFAGGDFRVSDREVERMRDSMAHRGPDGSGLYVSPDHSIGLGHRRLSILDLSASASQPMCNEDGTLWVVFNGEIYNHREIRDEINRRGRHSWKTDHSDTETILHGFEEWGIDCIHKFRGMFAFGIWDARKRQLWLVRDRIGIKPLYYSLQPDRLSFASEIKALLQDKLQKREVNEEAFFHYLSFATTPAPHTLFRGIRKLSPGSWLRVDDNGRIREFRYWDVWDHTEPLRGADDGEIAERVLGELRTSVRLRKLSDVPVGVFLSGGIDSSTNAALFSQGEDRPVKTFSIGYDRQYRSYGNELDYARQMARTVAADHHERVLGEEDMLSFLPQMVRQQDEPIADPVCVPIYYVSQLARSHGVIVCQIGEGADELFCGYPEWKIFLDLQHASDIWGAGPLKMLTLAGLRAARPQGHTCCDRLGRCYELLRRGKQAQPVFWGGTEIFTDPQKLSLLSPRLRERFSGFSSWEAIQPIRQRFEEKAWERSALHWMSYLDLNMRLPELLLMRVDKMSMATSVEARVPFLDHKFVELAMSIPAKMKTRHGVLKYVLKKAVRGIIPDQLIDRKKQGFGMPVTDWFYSRYGGYLRQEVKAFCDSTDFLDWPMVEKALPSRGWLLLNFALWWKEYIASVPCKQEESYATIWKDKQAIAAR